MVGTRRGSALGLTEAGNLLSPRGRRVCLLCFFCNTCIALYSLSVSSTPTFSGGPQIYLERYLGGRCWCSHLQGEAWSDLSRFTELDPKPRRSDSKSKAVTSSHHLQSRCSCISHRNGWMDCPEFGGCVRGRLV